MTEEAALLKKLNTAIATGASEVTINGRRIVYRSLQEMRSIRDELQRKVDGARSNGPDVLKPYFDKGY